MATCIQIPLFVSASIFDSSCTRTLLDWTIADVNDDTITVDSFYSVVLSLCAPEARQHVAEET